MITYRTLQAEELNRALFRAFIRHQVVKDCWRRVGNQWVIKPAPFIDDWNEDDYKFLVSCLQNTLAAGGFVYAAFSQGLLKGFVSVESEPFGENREYLDLSSLHVSEDFRRQGIGAVLFRQAKKWAKSHGAKKLYLSSHSAVESQAFYRAMGCTEAQFYHSEHVKKEPFDCQLECIL